MTIYRPTNIVSARLAFFFVWLVLCKPFGLGASWGISSSDDDDYSKYGVSYQRGWMSSASSLALKVEGCVWGYVSGNGGNSGDDEREDMNCMENESEDGTTYWYWMANCRRAQVAYSVFASDSCSSNAYKETLVTTKGVAEFISILSSYDNYSPFGDDDSYNDMPMCEEDGNGYYMSIGCASDGSFTLDRFSDQYCTQHYDTYDSLDNLNSAMSNLQSCHQCYDSSYDNSIYYSTCGYLMSYSETCSSLDSSICSDSNFLSGAGGRSSRHSGGIVSVVAGASRPFINKIKYAVGGILLLASLVMFLGILFTNRRRRRAMMHRKFRQSSGRSESRRRSSSRGKERSRSERSRSRSGRDGHSSGRSRRTKSRPREESGPTVDDGVFT